MNTSTFNLYLETLDQQRTQVLKKLQPFFCDWYLAGGTALALQLGHRISFDFDLFSQHAITSSLRKASIDAFGNALHFTMDTPEQLTFFTPEQVKITFAITPYAPLYPLITHSLLCMEDVRDIAADKAFVLGRRGAYRDYVDMFAILHTEMVLTTIIHDASQKYGSMFSEKLFLEQLDYMDDLTDFSIEYVNTSYTKDDIANTLHTHIQTYLQEKQATL